MSLKVRETVKPGLGKKNNKVMMGTRQKLKSGDEWDMLYWKEVLACFNRSKLSKKIKKRLSRRRRRKEKIINKHLNV